MSSCSWKVVWGSENGFVFSAAGVIWWLSVSLVLVCAGLFKTSSCWSSERLFYYKHCKNLPFDIHFLCNEESTHSSFCIDSGRTATYLASICNQRIYLPLFLFCKFSISLYKPRKMSWCWLLTKARRPSRSAVWRLCSPCHMLSVCVVWALRLSAAFARNSIDSWLSEMSPWN